MKSAVGFDGGVCVVVPVSNVDRSVEFFRDVLGLEIHYDITFAEGERRFFEFHAETPRVTIGLLETPGERKPGNEGVVTMAFGVKDIDVARRLLEERNVRFVSPTFLREGEPDVRLAVFLDPDGNAFMFYQDMPAKP